MTEGRCNSKWDSIIHGSIWSHEHDTNSLQTETVHNYCSSSVLTPSPVHHPCASEASGLPAMSSICFLLLYTLVTTGWRTVWSLCSAICPSSPGQPKVATVQCCRMLFCLCRKGQSTAGKPVKLCHHIWNRLPANRHKATIIGWYSNINNNNNYIDKGDSSVINTMVINFPELSNGYFRTLSLYIMNTAYISSFIFF